MATLIVISDIHGNLRALQAAWRDIQRRPFDALLCLGDIAAFGPDPEDSITFLRDVINPTAAIAGNTDRYLVNQSWGAEPKPGAEQALAWTHRKLSSLSLAWLEALPATANVEVGGVDVELLHGAPGDDELGIGPRRRGDTFDITPVVERFASHRPGLSVCGHTHVPWRGRLGARDVLNVGSIGFPFDGDPRAAYAVVVCDGGAIRELEWRRVAYPVDLTIDDLERSDMPWRDTLVRRLRFAESG